MQDKSLRAGLLVYAGLLLLNVVLPLLAPRSLHVEVWTWTRIALELMGCLAWWFMRRASGEIGIRGLALGGVVVAVLSVVTAAAQGVFDHMILSAHSFTVIVIESVVVTVTNGAEALLILLVCLRLGRKLGARTVRVGVGIGLFATAVKLMLFALAIANVIPRELPAALRVLSDVTYFSEAAVIFAMCIYLALRFRFVQPEKAAAVVANSSKLAPAWSAAAEGISLYLGAGIVRILLALGTVGVIMGARGAQSFAEIGEVRQSVIFIAVLSGITSLVMLAGAFRLTRVPREADAQGAAVCALALMAIGLFVDFGTTAIIADALSGSISSALDAQKILPLLGALAAGIGIGAGACLLLSLRKIAAHLERIDLSSRAKSTTVLLVVVGGSYGMLQLTLAQMSGTTLTMLAFVVLPLAIALLVQFLRVMLGVRRAVLERI